MNHLLTIPSLINKSNPHPPEAAAQSVVTEATASLILLLSIVLNSEQLGLGKFQPKPTALSLY